MRKRPQPEASPSSSSASKSEPQASDEQIKTGSSNDIHVRSAKRSGLAWTVAFAAFVYATYGVYYYQYEHMPPPLTADQAGKRGFSEFEAIKHVKALTELGPHPVGSDALDRALQYVLAAAQKIKETKHWEVDVEVDFFHAKSGANRLVSGAFMGRTLIYSDLNHIVLRIQPKYASEAAENAILVSSHIDTVFAAEGAGDCSSCVAVMLELARAMSQWAHGFKNAVIFLFNTGEEEGLNGAHSFVTQAGPHPWAVENFAAAAKYPSGQVTAQDLFASGAITSATDFQVYKEVAGLSGLDFAYTDKSAVYHTKNDKLDLLKPGSLQHLGENMLAFLLQAASSTSLPKGNAMEKEGKTVHETAVYFDILGTYMVLYRQGFANMLHNSVIVQSLLIWTASLVMGGYPAAVSLALTCLSAILMLWLILLALGNFYKIGSTFIALFWLVPPAFAYGFLEATLTPVRFPRPLKLATLLLGLAVPVLVSAGNFIRLANVIVAIVVRFDRNPGGTPEWLGNVILAVFIAVVLCLTLVYLLSYVHLSGAKRPIAIASCVLFVLSLILVLSGTVPPFSEDTARAVNVVHVVDASGKFGGKQEPSSFIALYSTTPGKLTKEVEQIKEGFVCGRDNVVDFVTLSMEYGCLTYDGTEGGWSQSDVPTIHVESEGFGIMDTKGNDNGRITKVSIDMKGSVRWSLAIDAEEIEDFTFKEGSEELVPRDEKSGMDGWHIIQFSGGKNAVSKFDLDLYWAKNSTESYHNANRKEKQRPLLKLRTDFDRLTPKTERVLSKLPAWCSLFGKSTSPQTLSFLNSLPVNF
ncbi:hypothetical protein CUMW_178710 [Citrus unshiu]|nr:hypothetical protein CUMW_178710 [Citrus unshiu]